MIEVLLRFAYAVVVLLIIFGLLAGAIYYLKEGIQVKTYRLPKSWVPNTEPPEWIPEPMDTKIKKYVALGHTYHCACRMVWGDGVCECLVKYPLKLRRVEDEFKRD